MKEAFSIKNKHGLLIRGVMEWSGTLYGPLVIMCHGFRGFMTQPQVKNPAGFLVKNGYTVVRFDATNGIGVSDGPLVNFTIGGYIQDIKRVIDHVLISTKNKRYTLIGYSAGAVAGYIIAAHDRRMNRLVLQSPPYDFKAIIVEQEDNFPALKERGWAIVYSESKHRNIKIGYSFYKERLRYNPDTFLKGITCPVLLIYGSKDKSSFRNSYGKLFKKVKRITKRIIPNAPHTLRKKQHIAVFSQAILKWLRK